MGTRAEERLGQIVQAAMTGDLGVTWEETAPHRRARYQAAGEAVEAALLAEMTQQGRLIVVSLPLLHKLEALARTRHRLLREPHLTSGDVRFLFSSTEVLVRALEAFPDWQGTDDEWRRRWDARFAAWQRQQATGDHAPGPASQPVDRGGDPQPPGARSAG